MNSISSILNYFLYWVLVSCFCLYFIVIVIVIWLLLVDVFVLFGEVPILLFLHTDLFVTIVPLKLLTLYWIIVDIIFLSFLHNFFLLFFCLFNKEKSKKLQPPSLLLKAGSTCNSVEDDRAVFLSTCDIHFVILSFTYLFDTIPSRKLRLNLRKSGGF